MPENFFTKEEISVLQKALAIVTDSKVEKLSKPSYDLVRSVAWRLEDVLQADFDGRLE